MAEDNTKDHSNVDSNLIQMTENFRLINMWESDVDADIEEILEDSHRGGLSHERENG